MTRTERLSLLLGLTYGDERTFAAQFALDRAEEYIKAYCRLDAVPAELDNAALAMAMDFYRAENPGGEAAVGPVKSITEGDAAVSFGGAASDNPGMAFLKDYAALLNRYRKAGW
ncbi:MAG: hypothetical protein PHT34_04985 [Oscillospiraceae bacterium]|nr:hypothetical protein [Oscillospiraceae bacterium]